MDPFCKLIIETTTEKIHLRSRTVQRGGKHPIFNETLYCQSYGMFTSITIEAWDEDPGTNDFIGRGQTQLSHLQMNYPCPMNLPLMTRWGREAGSLQLSFTLRPAGPMQSAPPPPYAPYAPPPMNSGQYYPPQPVGNMYPPPPANMYPPPPAMYQQPPPAPVVIYENQRPGFTPTTSVIGGALAGAAMMEMANGFGHHHHNHHHHHEGFGFDGGFGGGFGFGHHHHHHHH